MHRQYRKEMVELLIVLVKENKLNRKVDMAIGSTFCRKCHIYNHKDYLSNQVKNYTKNTNFLCRKMLSSELKPNAEFECQLLDIFKLKFAIQSNRFLLFLGTPYMYSA